MIKFENTKVMGWEAAIRGMRNPMNSWEKSDSLFLDENGYYYNIGGNLTSRYEDDRDFVIGPNDHDLMMLLATGGPVYAKYRRMIIVYVDITAPLYCWKEFNTYKVGTVSNSCSTMHKIATKEFTLEDFSCEHLVNIYTLQQVIKDINFWRGAYLISDEYERMKYIRSRFDPEKVDPLTSRKDCWWQMIQLLPASYNQRRTIMFNYEVLARIYPIRKNHKLDEWVEFCQWIESLPYSEIITGDRKGERI